MLATSNAQHIAITRGRSPELKSEGQDADVVACAFFRYNNRATKNKLVSDSNRFEPGISSNNR